MGWGAVALWEEERSPPHTPPPGPVFPTSAEIPAILPPSPLEVPWTDSHPQVTGIPLTAFFTTPQIQMSAFMWRLSPGLIETRPPSLHPPAFLLMGTGSHFTPMGFL